MNRPPWHGRLCFVTCLNEGFIAGAKGLVRSIRRFYDAEEAAIIAFAEADYYGLRAFCRAWECELHLFDRIQEWALPLIYSDPAYRNDRSHFYHPEYEPAAGLTVDEARRVLGFDVIRHLDPLHVKSYCTGFALLIRGYEYVVHIDADAFLLWRLDDVLETLEPNTVVGFDDGEEPLANLERLYGVRQPGTFTSRSYAFNAGVIFYRYGEGVRRLLLDFMHYTESCHHFTHSGYIFDQGLLRATVAKHHLLGHIGFTLRDAVNWNPTHARADRLQFVPVTAEWINEANGRRQHVWHGAGQPKLWTGRHPSASVNAAWRFVGGEILTRPFLILKKRNLVTPPE